MTEIWDISDKMDPARSVLVRVIVTEVTSVRSRWLYETSDGLKRGDLDVTHEGLLTNLYDDVGIEYDNVYLEEVTP